MPDGADPPVSDADVANAAEVLAGIENLTARDDQIEPLDGGRVDLVGTQVVRVWAEHRGTVYADDTGAPQPIPGGLQIVFCDRSTPHQKDGRWSLYEGLREELVARGMAGEAIRFIHDYPKPADKTALFRDCRNGKVAVLMGSMEKMGTGTNIQDRAVALHHMDVPWRPADLEQREGRLLRQGNKNASVQIFNYVTEGTFDTVMWQTVKKRHASLRSSRPVTPTSGRWLIWAVTIWVTRPRRRRRSPPVIPGTWSRCHSRMT